MQIYTLTPMGHKVARSVSNPSSPAYRVVHFLDNHGAATVDQVADYLGMSQSEAGLILGKLKRNRPQIVREASGVEI